MGSQRGARAPSRYNEDGRGEIYYPSDQGYVYDWTNSWPSGRGATAQVKDGLTVTTGALGATADLTCTGTTTAEVSYDLRVAYTLDSDNVLKVVKVSGVIPDATGATAAGAAIEVDVDALSAEVVATASIGVVTLSLTGAGTIQTVTFGFV